MNTTGRGNCGVDKYYDENLCSIRKCLKCEESKENNNTSSNKKKNPLNGITLLHPSSRKKMQCFPDKEAESSSHDTNVLLAEFIKPIS